MGCFFREVARQPAETQTKSLLDKLAVAPVSNLHIYHTDMEVVLWKCKDRELLFS